MRTIVAVSCLCLGALWLVGLGILLERHTRAERKSVAGLPALERRMITRASFGIFLLGLGAVLLAR